MINYKKYRFTLCDYFQIIGLGLGTILLVSYLFYDNLYISIVLSPYLFIYFKRANKSKVIQQRAELVLQFKEAMQAIASGLEAGQSVEHAFEHAREDLIMIYSKESYICKELLLIRTQSTNNIPIEKSLEDFARRSSLDDIMCFSEVFSTAKRTGGNMIQIIKNTCRTIGRKIEVSREIETMITAKKYEAKIMRMMPFGIIFYLRICSPEFLGPLYHNTFGIIFMSLALIILQGFSLLSETLMKIDI